MRWWGKADVWWSACHVTRSGLFVVAVFLLFLLCPNSNCLLLESIIPIISVKFRRIGCIRIDPDEQRLVNCALTVVPIPNTSNPRLQTGDSNKRQPMVPVILRNWHISLLCSTGRLASHCP